MFSPTLKIDKNQRMYISDKYITNGHWLVTRDVCKAPQAPKALKALLTLQLGSYLSGIAHEVDPDPKSLPDMAAIIPKRDGYVPLSNHFAPTGVQWNSEWNIKAYKFEFPQVTVINKVKPEDPGVSSMQVEIGVDVNYVPILRLGFSFAVGARSPLIVLDGSSLNDHLLAIVMPMRL